jgi:hypothetical protein
VGDTLSWTLFPPDSMAEIFVWIAVAEGTRLASCSDRGHTAAHRLSVQLLILQDIRTVPTPARFEKVIRAPKG